MKRIAIISPNQGQYSETFIRTQIDNIAGVERVYSGGYQPTLQSLDRGQHYTELDGSWWGKGNWEKRFSRALRVAKIDLVLIQYGLTAVEVMDVLAELRIPFIVHFHGFDAYRMDVMKDYADRYPLMFQRAKAVIAVSRDMLGQLQKLGCPEQKLYYIPYGVDAHFFHPDESRGKYFLACGRFVEKKGPLITLQAFSELCGRYPEARLRMIGDGPLMEAAAQFVQARELTEKVKLIGVLSPEQVAEEMRGAFCFLQHSRITAEGDSEGTPLAILEAAATALPIIATRHAGIKDVVADGESGILVSEGAVEETAQAMEKLFLNPDLAERMGERGRSIVLERYTKSEYLRKLTELITGKV